MASEAIYPLLPAFFMRELGLTSVGVGLLDGLASATAAIVRLPAGMLSDRMGRRPLVIVGYALAAVHGNGYWAFRRIHRESCRPLWKRGS